MKKKKQKEFTQQLLFIMIYTNISYQFNGCYLHHGLRNRRVSRFESIGQCHNQKLYKNKNIRRRGIQNKTKVNSFISFYQVSTNDLDRYMYIK